MDGCDDGCVDGCVDGCIDGCVDGCADDGSAVGSAEGSSLGSALVGCMLGCCDDAANSTVVVQKSSKSEISGATIIVQGRGCRSTLQGGWGCREQAVQGKQQAV